MQSRQIFFPRQGEVDFETVDLPEAGAGQVLVETIASVISPGTELAWLHALPDTPGKFPMRIAYCACGRVVARGPEVDDLSEGQLVVHQSLHCSARVLDAAKCIPVPEGLAPEEAATSPLVAIALQGIRKSQVTVGESAAVLGLGLIGNLAGQLARVSGALPVVGIDPDRRRCELALECGFDAAVESVEQALQLGNPYLSAAEGYEVVVEASGAPAAVPQAFQAAAEFGRVILLGSTRGTTEAVDFYRPVHRKGITIIGAHNACRPKVDEMFPVKTMRRDLHLALVLLARGRIRVQPLISEKVPADAAPEAYRRLWSRSENLVTIALDWTATPAGR